VIMVIKVIVMTGLDN